MTGHTSREDALLKECACFDLRRAWRAVKGGFTDVKDGPARRGG